MKITYETTATLAQEQIFCLMKESIEKKTGRHLANIYWDDSDAGMTCKLVFCVETEELPNA